MIFELKTWEWRGHHHHDIDQQQFASAQTFCPTQLEQRIDQPRQQGQQANRPDRAKAQGHVGALQVQGAIGHAATDESGQKGAQGKGPQRKGRASFFYGGLRVGRLQVQPRAKCRRQQTAKPG